MKKILLLVFMLIAMTSAKSQLATEQFNYTAHATNGLSAQSSGTWINLNTGDSILISSGNLNYPNLTTSAGNCITYAGTGTDYYRIFTNQATGTVYASFLLNISTISSQSTTGGYTFGFMENNSTSNFGATVWIRNTSSGGATSFNLGINPRTTAANTSWASNTLNINTTYLVVISYQIVSGAGNDIVKMWINPTSLGGTEPSATATSTNTGTDLTNGVQRFFCRQDAANTTPTLKMDELRIGTSWSDVTPSVISSNTALTSTTFNNLTITNSNVSMNGNITITGTLTLNNSFLSTGSDTLIIGNSISNLGAIVKNGGGIIGILKRWIATGSSGTTSFPIINSHWVTGNGRNYDDVNIDINFTNAPSSGGTLTAKYDTLGSGTLFDNGGLGYISASTLWPGVNFINLSPQKWTINAGDGLTGYVYDISLTGNGMNLSTTATLYTAIVKRTNNSQPWAWNSTNHTMTTGSSTPILGGTGFNSFSEFAVVGNVDNLLPVELESFVSTVNNNTVRLEWKTSYEENNLGFDIERKFSESADWQKINHIASNISHQYSYTDVNLNSGIYHYRLKQIDFNGAYKYYNLSNNVIIANPQKYFLSQNYPNPFNLSTKINFQLAREGFVEIKIFDIQGREVKTILNEIKKPGFYNFEINLENMPSSIYYYRISTEGFSESKKMILIK